MDFTALPESLKAKVRQPRNNARLRLQALVNVSRAESHDCNLCGHSGRFAPFGNPPRRGASCGRCGSLERHRLLGLWFDSNPGVLEGAKVLHFAPEQAVKQLLKRRAFEYQSADIDPQHADLQINIENIALPDNSVDIVVCSHVLEHVDDSKTLNELYRILKPRGRALLMFPVIEGWEKTYENPAIISPADRAVHFGQFDHVRYFGRDVRDRITKAGFELTEFTAEEPDVARYGLNRGEKVFVATKPL